MHGRVWRRERKRKWRADAVADGSGRLCAVAGTVVENARGGRFDRVATADARVKNIRPVDSSVLSSRRLRRWCALLSASGAKSALGTHGAVRTGRLYQPMAKRLSAPVRPTTGCYLTPGTRWHDDHAGRVMRKCYKYCRFPFNGAAFAINSSSDVLANSIYCSKWYIQKLLLEETTKVSVSLSFLKLMNVGPVWVVWRCCLACVTHLAAFFCTSISNLNTTHISHILMITGVGNFLLSPARADHCNRSKFDVLMS